METKTELKAFKYAKGTSEAINNKIASIKQDNVSLFRMHKDSVKLLNLELSNELSLNGIDIKSQVLKDLKTKDKISPIEVIGAYSLDKFIKFLGVKANFYGLMSTHVKAMYQICTLSNEERQTIFTRGKELNELKSNFLGGKVSAYDFINELFTYFPSFHENLKNSKIAPNVARFMFENTKDLYDTLKISNIIDIAEENKERAIKKERGTNGLIAYQAKKKEQSARNIKKVATVKTASAVDSAA